MTPDINRERDKKTNIGSNQAITLLTSESVCLGGWVSFCVNTCKLAHACNSCNRKTHIDVPVAHLKPVGKNFVIPSSNINIFHKRLMRAGYGSQDTHYTSK